MSSRDSTRGGRGARSGRGGRGASATAAVPSTRPSIEGTDGEAPVSNAPTTTAARAITIESSQSATNSPASTPAPSSSTRGGRFKPKAVRRDAAERQKLEDQRARDLAAKIKVEEREQRDADRRARRGGQRGRGRGDAGFIRRTVTGSGAFSGIGQDMLRQGGGGWGKNGDAGVKSEGFNRYHDRRANDVRVNVDTLRDSVTPEVGLGTNGVKSGVLPMGIIRVEHKEEEAKVATSAELEAEEQEDDDDDELFVSEQAKVIQRDIHMADDNEVWNEGPRKNEDDKVVVKPEPGTEDDVMDIDNIPAKAPDSPELKKKPTAQEVEKDAKTIAKEKKREKLLQDPELQSAAVDTATLLEALTLKEGDTQDKDNQLFLFQFPPILPPLLHLNEDGSEVVDLEERAGANGVKTKSEAGTSVPITTTSALPAQGGFVGRLNVRKSGKVELDWGGRILDLGIATDTDYLTTAIIVDEQEGESGGKATGMGPVYGKFVATPVFQEEEDWNPDLDSLGLWV